MYILVPKVDSFVEEEHSKAFSKCKESPDEQDAPDIVISKNTKNSKF